jgi:membrane protein required for colicin V production
MSGIGPFKGLDLILIAVVAISGLVAMYRGLMREVLSIVSWIAASGAALYVIFREEWLALELAKLFDSSPQPVHNIIAKIGVGVVVFLVVLIIVHFITFRISNAVQDSPVGAIDRILGLAFGMLRGFILVVIPYMFAVSFICPGGAAQATAQGCPLAPWVDEAKSLDMIKGTGKKLYGILESFTPKALSSG